MRTVAIAQTTRSSIREKAPSLVRRGLTAVSISRREIPLIGPMGTLGLLVAFSWWRAWPMMSIPQCPIEPALLRAERGPESLLGLITTVHADRTSPSRISHAADAPVARHARQRTSEGIAARPRR